MVRFGLIGYGLVGTASRGGHHWRAGRRTDGNRLQQWRFGGGGGGGPFPYSRLSGLSPVTGAGVISTPLTWLSPIICIVKSALPR